MRRQYVGTFLGLAGALALSGTGCGRKPVVEQAENTRVVRVEPVQRADLEEWLTLSGEVRGDLEVDVYPELAERITAVRVAMGDRVKAGQVLFELRKGTLADGVVQARAGLDAARVRLATAEADLARNEKLHQAGLASDAQLLQMRTAVDGARAQLVQLEASLRQSRTVEDKTVVVAPIDGWVGKVTGELGRMAVPQAALCSIARFDDVKVTASAADVDFPRLAIGLKTRVTSDTLPDMHLDGTLSRLSPVIDRVSRSVAVEAMFANPEHLLRPGMLVTLRVLLASHPQALVVGNQALMNRTAAGEAGVFVLDAGHARARAVKVGFRDGERVQVLDGLRDGEQVIVLGQNAVSDGDPVKLETSSAAQASAGPAPAARP